MLRFYDVNPIYADFLRQFDNHIPNINYETNNKFVCGIVLSANGYNYFAPISSSKKKQQTSFLIEDSNGTVLSSIKFGFMFPVPNSEIFAKDFGQIRKVDPLYANLLEKEYRFCRKNERNILERAAKVYEIGCNPEHVLHKFCCDFPILEIKHDEYLLQ